MHGRTVQCQAPRARARRASVGRHAERWRLWNRNRSRTRADAGTEYRVYGKPSALQRSPSAASRRQPRNGCHPTPAAMRPRFHGTRRRAMEDPRLITDHGDGRPGTADMAGPTRPAASRPGIFAAALIGGGTGGSSSTGVATPGDCWTGVTAHCPTPGRVSARAHATRSSRADSTSLMRHRLRKTDAHHGRHLRRDDSMGVAERSANRRGTYR